MNLRTLSTAGIILFSLFTSARGQALLYELTSSSEYEFGRYGVSVSGVPDLDGDGRGDFVIGAYGEANYAGRAHVYSGTELYLIEGSAEFVHSPGPSPACLI